ncbi:MAG: hypothetical protein BWY75_00054 [bacterium ADurb.Bin425]|nr:MAG: hypothetical protein BWY75_00054 [bacterium ADurb.Bin425]
MHSSEQILVGDAQYEARCIHCFEPPGEYQLRLDLPKVEQQVPTLVLAGVDAAVEMAS